MDNLFIFLLIGIIALNVTMLISFFGLCSNVSKLLKEAETIRKSQIPVVSEQLEGIQNDLRKR